MNVFTQISIELWLFLALTTFILIMIGNSKKWNLIHLNRTDYTLFDIKEVLDKVITSVHSTSEHENIHIKYFSTLEQTTFIKGNKNKFHLALFNLVKNVLDTSQNGKIEIAVHEMLSSILIIIEHNGKQLTNEQIRKLTGILPSTEIISSMRGKIEVVSQQGKGTILSVKIPKAPGFNAKTV